MKVKELLRRFSPGRIPDATPESNRAVVRRIISRCPVCELNLDGHAYAELATVFATDAAALSDLRDSIETGGWARLTALQQWDPEADVIQCDAIRCSRREELGLVRILYTAEMWADDRVEDARRLTLEESQRLGLEVGDRWISF
jgi:hypothetical protein